MAFLWMIILVVILQFGLGQYCRIRGFGYGKKQQIAAIASNAGIVALFFYKYHYSLNILLISLFSTILVSIFFVDWKHYIIPDEYNAALFVLSIIFIVHNHTHWFVFLKGGIYFFVLFMILWFVSNGNLGGGDIKMAVPLGLILGSGYFLNYMIVTFLTGAFVSLILISLKIKNKNDKIPFGPYMVIAFLYLLLT